MSDLLDRSLSIANEHAAWAASHGQTPALIFEALDLRPPPGRAGWDDVVAELARQWRLLPGQIRK
jgi:hypothetical protein